MTGPRMSPRGDAPWCDICGIPASGHYATGHAFADKEHYGDCSDCYCDGSDVTRLRVRLCPLHAAAGALMAALEAIVQEIRAYETPECDDPNTISGEMLAEADKALASARGETK